MKTAVKTVEMRDTPDAQPEVKPLYLEALTLVERLHRRLLDVIKDEFERQGGTTSTASRRCCSTTSATRS